MALEKQVYGSGKLQEFFLLLCDHPVSLPYSKFIVIGVLLLQLFSVFACLFCIVIIG